MAKKGTARVTFPISVKLVTIITALAVTLIASLTVIVSIAVSGDVRKTAESENFTINTRSSAEAETLLSDARSNVFLLLNLLGAFPGKDQVVVTRVFFERNPKLAAVAVPGAFSHINSAFFAAHDLDEGAVADFLGRHGDELERARAGEACVLNATADFRLPMLVLLYPFRSGEENQAVAAFFAAESLTESFGTGANASVLINYAGDLLVSADYEAVKTQANVADWGIVERMAGSSQLQEQIIYETGSGERFFGSYSRLPAFNAAVITSISYQTVFEGVEATTRRNMYLGAAIIFLAIIFILLFSKTISRPVRALTAAAAQIKEGQYLLDIKPTTRDELGLLTESFVQMGVGLSEREKLKDTFGRFINKEIAEKAMKGELTLGGETKNITVFFTDIRSFTAMSEKLSPAEVVAFLNEYMTQMVECVTRSEGVVDKFIGDAIMAVWGAPVSSGDVAKDALHAVRAALWMRYSLYKYNNKRKEEGKAAVKIGVGINSGPVVAGQIGSNERMEYTVIGDAVNLASRVEALNKPFHTDIIITEYTYELVKEHVTVAEMPPVSVKGKEEPVRIFAVIHEKGVDGAFKTKAHIPQTIQDVRKILALPEPDLGGVNTDEEEKKYKINAK